MPIYKRLLCTADQLQQIRDLTERVSEDLPPSGEDFARLLRERQRAKDEFKALIASLRPPTLDDLAVEVERLQNEIESLRAKLAEGGRSHRAKKAG
jgi:predicted  nucleic acid-binding Zn-ribbon protein